jgi:hypothetical protein
VERIAAFRAFLFPGPDARLFFLGFGFLCGSQFQSPRFVGLLHRALGMNAA